ncbi:hypothetical protein F5B21DRAFT_455431 [Xylaria acuta]|nr:hypothetical protein F5B21DRAFT_455431 [Xylaria acuta]
MAPRHLLLVRRAFYAEAIRVLYSCNRINIPSIYYTLRPFRTNPAVSLDASQFIMLPKQPQCFQHLRTLEITILKIQPDFHSLTSDPVYLNWIASIEHLKAHANLPGLTLIVGAELFDDVFPPVESFIPDIDILEKQPLKRYYEFLRPLQALRGGGDCSCTLNGNGIGRR